MAKVDFVTAHKEGLGICAGGGVIGWADTPKAVAYIFKTYGLHEAVAGDFKSGSYHEDLFNEALKIYNWEVNRIAG